MTIKRVGSGQYLLGATASAAAAQLEGQGFRLPERPKSTMPSLPDDITELSDKDLMDLYAEFVGWSEYAFTQLSAASVNEKEEERRLAVSTAREVALLRMSGMNVTDARNGAKDKMSDLVKRVAEAEAYRKVLEAVAEGCDKSASLLSRELTRRTNGAEQSRRSGSRFTL